MRWMRLMVAGLCAGVAIGASAQGPAGGGDADTVTVARRAAGAWVGEVDAGHYGDSWEHASSFFRAGVAKPQWETAIKAYRDALGGVKTRVLKSATRTRTLPGAPDGDYVVIEYETRFDNKADAVETITPMLDSDGYWKVSGYFIR